jgi:hypothetical protein
VSRKQGDADSEEWLRQQFLLSLGSVRPPRPDPAEARYKAHLPRGRTALATRAALGLVAAALATGTTVAATEATGSPSPAVWVGRAMQRCGQGQCLGGITSAGSQGSDRQPAQPDVPARPPPADDHRASRGKPSAAPVAGRDADRDSGAAAEDRPPAAHARRERGHRRGKPGPP